MTEALLLTHGAATWFMVGLIWVIQTVHYPLWVHVSSDQSHTFHRRHSRRIGWLIALAGGIEFMTAILLLVFIPTALTVTGICCLLGIWSTTILVQIPMHRRLASEWGDQLIIRLVSGNWIRTAIWSARGALAIAMMR